MKSNTDLSLSLTFSLILVTARGTNHISRFFVEIHVARRSTRRAARPAKLSIYIFANKLILSWNGKKEGTTEGVNIP